VKHEGEIPRQPRRHRLIHEHVHDPYKTRLKLPEPTVSARSAVPCSTRGGGSGRHGPTTHTKSSARRATASTSAMPAGEVAMAGEFVSRHKHEIRHVAPPGGSGEGGNDKSALRGSALIWSGWRRTGSRPRAEAS
jgi:hypothetical protein